MARLKTLRPQVASLDVRRAKPMTVELQRTRGTTWMNIRYRVLRRANGVCECADCRGSGRIRPAQEVDHIVPLWQGGTDDESNLQAINIECHKVKTAREAATRGGSNL